MSTRNSERSRR